MFGNHGLGGLLEEGAHEKSPKCLGGNLGDFGEFCKGLRLPFLCSNNVFRQPENGQQKNGICFNTDAVCLAINWFRRFHAMKRGGELDR